jgi:hypothetical protein
MGQADRGGRVQADRGLEDRSGVLPVKRALNCGYPVDNLWITGW